MRYYTFLPFWEGFSVVNTKPDGDALQIDLTPQKKKKKRAENSPRVIGFKGEANPKLSVVGGPIQGLEATLDGLYISLGNGNLQADVLTGDPKAAKFDQMLELPDPSIVPNHLLLRWDALKNGFSAWKNPAALKVTVSRVADGCTWVTEIVDQSALLRVGDSFVLGRSTIQIRQPSEETRSRSQVPLVPSDS